MKINKSEVRKKLRSIKVNKRKVSLIIALAIFVSLIGWQVYQKAIKPGRSSGLERTAIPVAVEVAAVKKATILDYGNFTGTLTPKSQFMVAPKISGRLEKLMVNIGDRVERNQLIALLDDEEYNQQVRQAEADLQVARANLEESLSSMNLAERELERTEELHKRGISADSELDSARGVFATQEARYKVAQAQVANKEAALEAANVRLSYTKIKATWEEGVQSRVVGERLVDEGAMLTPNAPILSILEINSLLAIMHITDKDYFKVKVGQTAIISTDAIPDKTASGKVVRIAPLLKETSREARIEIEFSNPGELFKPGMFVIVRIEYATHADATVVPVSSVVKRDSREGVFITDKGKNMARFVPVEVGISNTEMAEIIDPPQLSGFVVTLGQHLLVDGSPIILPQPSSPQDEGNTKKLEPQEKR